MKEMKKIRKYLLDERENLQEQLQQYQQLLEDVNAKIEHSSRYVLSMAASRSDDQNIFSPYGRNKRDNLEEENFNLENLTRQAEVVKRNLSELTAKAKAMDSYLEMLEPFTGRDFYFLDSKEYDKVQNLLDAFQKDLRNEMKEYEKKLKQFIYVDPQRSLTLFQEHRKKIETLLEQIAECETILSDNRRGNA